MTSAEARSRLEARDDANFSAPSVGCASCTGACSTRQGAEAPSQHQCFRLHRGRRKDEVENMILMHCVASNRRG